MITRSRLATLAVIALVGILTLARVPLASSQGLTLVGGPVGLPQLEEPPRRRASFLVGHRTQGVPPVALEDRTYPRPVVEPLAHLFAFVRVERERVRVAHDLHILAYVATRHSDLTATSWTRRARARAARSSRQRHSDLTATSSTLETLRGL